MAPPYPRRLPVAGKVGHGRGLRVMDEDEVVVVLQERRVAAVGLQVRLSRLLRKVVACTLQRVVEALRDLEQRGASVDDLPACIHAQVLEQGHRGPQQLGHPASVGGGVDVGDAAALQGLRKLPEATDLVLPHNRGVSINGEAAGGHRLEHCCSPSLKSSLLPIHSFPSPTVPPGVSRPAMPRTQYSPRWWTPQPGPAYRRRAAAPSLLQGRGIAKDGNARLASSGTVLMPQTYASAWRCLEYYRGLPVGQSTRAAAVPALSAGPMLTPERRLA